jgi:formylglycine-generating enzyme required for sulfatase activity
MRESSAGSAPAADQAFTDAIGGMEFIAVPAGCFLMGDTIGDGESDEQPVHEVCLDGFSIGKYEINVGEFRKFVEATDYRTEAEKGGGCFSAGSDGKWSRRAQANWLEPGFSQTDSHPVVCLSWSDASAFSKWLSTQSGRTYRLPTEAEWEYAARGNTSGRNFWGDNAEDTCKYANVNDQAAVKTKIPKKTTHECNDGYVYTAPVGSFSPNAFGLYDMMGNAWEWTGDLYDKNYYKESPRNNPQGPPMVTGPRFRHVPRGGSWRSSLEHLRVSLRVHPPSPSAGVGFRLVSPIK